MKIIHIVISAVILSIVSLYAANTEEFIFSSFASISYKSDFGTVTVRAGQLPAISKWEAGTEPPLSLTNALAAAWSHLPKEDGGTWYLSSIGLTSFGEYDGYGEWYYLAAFYNVNAFNRDGTVYKRTKRYTSVIHLDGTVLVPRTEDNLDELEDVEQQPGT